jgi:hypothetical protein
MKYKAGTKISFDRRFNTLTEKGSYQRHQPKRKSIAKRTHEFWARPVVRVGVFFLILTALWMRIEHINRPRPIVEPASAMETVVTTPEIAPTLVVEKPLNIEQAIRDEFGIYGDRAVKIAQCESNLDPTRENLKAPDRSFGLFQVNTYGKLASVRPTREQLLDPITNIRTAKAIFDGAGHTFSKDWVVCYRLTK